MKATKTRESAYKVVKQAQNDPVSFMENNTGEHFWDKEREILNSLNKHNDVTVRSCHGSGKTFTAARAALWFFIAYPQSIVLSTAPTFNQVKNQLWRELNGAVSKSKISIPKANQTSLEAGDNWYALGLSTNNTDNFQGFHTDYILAIVDEASGVDEQIFDAVDGVLTSMHAKRLYIGNPLRRSGEFFRSHDDDDYQRIQISVFDTPNFKQFGITEEDLLNNTWRDKVDGSMPYPELVTPKWAHNFIKKNPKGSMGYTIKILGEFAENEEDTFINRSLVEQCVKNGITSDQPLQLGVDPSRFGSDQTGFVLRKGPEVVKMWSKPLTTQMEVSGEIVSLLRNKNISKVKIDTIGVGAGTYDRVEEVLNGSQALNAELIEVKGSEKSDSDQYYNKVAFLWGTIKERLQSGDINLPNNETLISQLSNRKYTYNSKGQVKLESKGDIKKRGLSSPDLADALSYAFYEDSSQSYGSMVDRYT